MERSSSSIFVLLVATVAFASCGKQGIAPRASPQPGAPKLVWSGNSGGYVIRWTTGDIIAAPQRTPVRESLSELGSTIVDFHAITRKQTSDCDFQRLARLQSVVGPFVSIQHNDSMHCANGTTGTGLAATAIDLAHPGSPAMLSAIFPADAVAGAALKARQLCKTLPENLLNRFAFSELHGNQVVVVLALSPDCSVSDMSMTLPVPAALKEPLLRAAQQREGFLWHDQAAISHGDVTTINYHYRTSVEP